MLKIYGAPISVHTRKAIIVANLKGEPHEVVPVIPVAPNTFPANWRRLSPAGLIPVIVEGEKSLADSTAICMFLDRTHPAQAVYPADPGSLAAVLSLEAYAGDRLFRAVVRVLFSETVIGPKIKQQPTNPCVVSEILNVIWLSRPGRRRRIPRRRCAQHGRHRGGFKSSEFPLLRFCD